MLLQVPFVPNTSDNNHCFQAVFWMVLKHFLPQKKFSSEDMEKFTGYKKDLWTWPTLAFVNLQKLGFDIDYVSLFETKEFIDRGENYLTEFFGEEIAQAEKEHSDILKEQNRFRLFLKHTEPIHYLPTLSDIKSYINKDYVVIVNVNSRTLNNREGYNGHALLVIGYDNDHIIVHDPGLPPVPERKIPRELFTKAWTYRNNLCSLVALRLQGDTLRG